MIIKKEDLTSSYFEVQCEKHGLDIKYMQFLDPRLIEFILIVCCIRLRKSNLIQMLNENEDPNSYRKYTNHYFDKKLSNARKRLWDLRRHAEIFGIEDNIIPLDVEQLHDLVDDYYTKVSKESENEVS